MTFILASKSPRRREILENIGLAFSVVTADADETCAKTDPCEYVKELALRKGEAVLRTLRQSGKLTSDTIVIASDTVVALENEILGKPRDKADAERMLRAFSGKEHRVISGIALLTEQKRVACAEVTRVLFDDIPEREIAKYVSTSEPYDKAGAYAIQGFAALWIRGIKGDYFNVVGFPLKRFADFLREEFSLSLADYIENKEPKII
ncbi:MAG: septum formation protein Maf [Clostridia bacterium]|nr:septum formation protein Maf [Clostridia bacterium]